MPHYSAAPKVRGFLLNELGFRGAPWRLSVVNALVAFWPEEALGRTRTMLFRACGIRIGRRSVILGRLWLRSGRLAAKNLSIGEGCLIYEPTSIDCADVVTIGDRVTLGPAVSLLTAAHDTSDPSHRAGDLVRSPITIGDGVWICFGATVLPGVTIGPGAVVAARALVTKDVPPNALVAGMPARLIRYLDSASPPSSRVED
jgi:maltose O-acetyltransferase